jgi:hypothetical protein
VAGIVYALAVVRGVQMSRAFVSRVFRNRASWVVGISAVILVNDFLGHVPYVNNVGKGGIPVSFLFFLILLAIVFVFVDSTVLVTLELDFFHRDTLRWRRARYMGYLAVIGEIAFIYLLLYFASLPTPPGWATTIANGIVFPIQFLLIFCTATGYGVAAMVIGARRTPDRAIRRHLLLLGIVLLLGVIAIINDFIASFVPLDDLLALTIAYLWYRAAMTLSLVGRIEKEGGATPPSRLSTAVVNPQNI